MIEQRIMDQLIELGLQTEKIHKIILFGSRAVGDYKEKSDLDLAFITSNMTIAEWTSFTFTIEEELDTLLLLDLIKFEDVPLELQDEILNTGKVIYCANSQN